MDITKLTTLVSSRSAFSLLGIPDDQKSAAIQAYAQAAVDRVAMRHDFNFAIGETTDATVASQSDYTLHGNQDDCREIINVRYGDDDELLDKYEGVQYDVDLGLFNAPTTPQLWYEIQAVNGFPTIRIVGTPTTVETLKYRFRRKNIPIAEYPEEWGFVLADFVLAMIADIFKSKDGQTVTYDFWGVAEKSMREMINGYRREGGGSPKRIQIDHVARVANIRRNRLYCNSNS